MAVYRIAIGSPREASNPAAIKAAVAEFFSMLIFVFAGQGSGMAYSEYLNYVFCFILFFESIIVAVIHG